MADMMRWTTGLIDLSYADLMISPMSFQVLFHSLLRPCGAGTSGLMALFIIQLNTPSAIPRAHLSTSMEAFQTTVHSCANHRTSAAVGMMAHFMSQPKNGSVTLCQTHMTIFATMWK